MGLYLKKMKTISKAILTRIEEINNLIPIVNDLSIIPFTYDGGTYPYYVILEHKIEIKNQYVYIQGPKNNANCYIEGKLRFNVNNVDMFADNGIDQLKHNLSVILKAFKKAVTL